MKEMSDYWYYFGKCSKSPRKIDKGCYPRSPYRAFDTKEECQEFIDKVNSGEKSWNVMEIMLGQKI